jgi:hypothetical protein
MVVLHLATVASAQELLKSLISATNGGYGYLDKLWQLFLFKGQLYQAVSEGAALFTALPLCIWVINHFRNQQAALEDPRLDTGDIIRYLILGMILFGLFNPRGTSAFLYDSKLVFFRNAADVTEVARKIADDPVTYMSSASAAERAYGEGLQVCNREADETKRDLCIEQAKKAADGKKSWTDRLFGWVPDPAKMYTETLMINLGTLFLLLLEVAQLLCCLFLPYVLLISIADYVVLWDWVKSFVTAGLVHTAYNICIISISFAMTQDDGSNTFLWSLAVGMGAPWLSIEIVTGQRFGILSGMGTIASRISGSIK